MSLEKIETENLVIGGGIAGTAAAWRFAEMGREVVLLEKGRIGEEASGRCGGGVRQQYRDSRETPFAIKAVRMWEEMAQSLDEDLEYDQGGNIKLLRTEEDLSIGRARVEREISQGLEVSFLSAEETRERLPLLSPDTPLFGATYCPSDGTANPIKVTKAIGREAAKIGAQLHINEPARHMVPGGDRVHAVRTDKAIYYARNIILAAGPWSGTLLFDLGLKLHLILKQSNILVTQPLDQVVPGFISWDTGYMRQAKDGNIHIGVRTVINKGFDKTLDYRVLMDAGRDFPEVFPFLRDYNIIRGFCGLLTYTADDIPVVDRAPGYDNLWVVTGFSGHGFCLGPYMGRVTADWIMKGECPEDLSEFSYGRFK